MLTSSGNEAQIRDAFRVFDKDDKGFLTVKKMTNMNYEDNDIANIKMRMRFPYIALSQDTKNMKVEVTFKTI